MTNSTTPTKQPYRRGRNFFTRALFHPNTYYLVQYGGLLTISYLILIKTNWKEGTIFYDVSF